MSLFLRVALWVGLTFLYLPIVVMIFYSFNASQRSSIWSHFTLDWYAQLFRDPQILQAAWLSVQIGVYSATIATILGIAAAVILTKFGAFRGRSLFAGMLTAPLVMPEVITGISLLLLFISTAELFGWPTQRGVMTVTIGHATLGTAFVLVVVQPRLRALNQSLEEASRDLGAGPLETFWFITLPLLLPAVIAGWLLAFVISFDDLVIASFTSGPGSSTLPMLIYSKVRIGLSPDVNALATLLILAVFVGLFIAWIMVRRDWRRGSSRP